MLKRRQTYFQILLFIFFILIAGYLYGQEFKNFNSNDGLPILHLTAITEDTYGNLWIGTSFIGALKYDGKSFESVVNYQGGYNKIHSIHRHPINSDTILAIGNKEISAVNVHTLKEQIIKMPIDNWIKKSISFEASKDILLLNKKGEVLSWKNNYRPIFYSVDNMINLGTDILLIQTDSIKLVNQNGVIIHSATNAQGRVYDATIVGNAVVLATENGLYRWQNESISKLETGISGIASVINFEGVIYLSNKEGLYMWKNQVLTKVKTPVIGRARFYADTEGILWMISSESGLYKKNVRTIEMIMPRQVNDRLTFDINYFRDKFFLGEYENGIKVLSKNYDLLFRFASNNNTTIVASAKTEDYLFFGSSDGLIIYHGDSGKFSGKLEDVYINEVYVEDSLLYIGSSEGKVWSCDIYDGFKLEEIIQLPLSSTINTITYINNKHLAIGTRKGLFIVNPKSNEILNVSHQKYNILNLKSINDSILVINKFGSGLELINFKSRETIERLNYKKHLPSNILYFIETYENNIWIGTHDGIQNLQLDEDYKVIRSIEYGKEQGFLGGETNSNASMINNDTLYFSTIDGIYKTSAKPDKKAYDSKGFIKYLVINESDTILNTNNNKFYLPPGVKSLEINYDKVDKTYNSSFTFTGILESSEEKFSSIIQNGYIRYFNLAPGAYNFSLRSADATEDDLIKASITVEPFFYQSVFFKLLMVSLSLLIVFGSILSYNQFRTNKINKREEKRQQEKKEILKWLSMDFHDDLGNKLARLLQFINVFEIIDDESKKTEIIEKIKGEIRYIYNDSRQYIYSIDPDYESLYSLFLNLKNYSHELYKFTRKSELQYNFYGDKQIKINPKIHAHLLKIFKEAITNSFKYAEADKVTLVMRVENNTIDITFNDNGTGFKSKSKEEKTGAGIINMKKRAENINAVLDIESAPAKGTKVQLNYKY